MPYWKSDDMLPITQEASKELQFWTECMDQYNTQSIRYNPAAVRCVYSDASNAGYGGYTVEHGMRIAHGNWLQDEVAQSFTWRELLVVWRVLDSVACNLRVIWFTVNQNVVCILQVGSAKLHIQVEALKVFKLYMYLLQNPAGTRVDTQRQEPTSRLLQSYCRL